MEGLESKLDAVGFSYLDDVPITLNSVYSLSVNLDEVNALLNKELPRVPVHCPYDWEKEKVRLKEFLSELESREAEKEREVEKLREEVLARKAEEEEKELEAQMSSYKCSSSSEESVVPQPPVVNEEKPVEPIPPINYSDFEAASDPFESAELQTINDLQELAACFPSVPQTPVFYYPPIPQSSNTILPGPTLPQPPPTTELKASKSFGDIVGEIKKERCVLQQQPRPSHVQRSSVSSAKGLENWTPWPSLDDAPKKNKKDSSPCPFEALPEDERTLCLSLREMGFSPRRLVKGVKSLGPDSDKIINFCLVVDGLKGKQEISVEEVEDIALKVDLKEAEAVKYLDVFGEVKELGFPSADIHDAMSGLEERISKDDVLKVLLKD